MDLSGPVALRRRRRPARRPGGRPRRPLRPQRRARPAGDPGAGGGQARARREADRADDRPTPTRCSPRRRASGKLLMVAHVLPFFPEFAFAAEAVALGAIRGAAGRPLHAGDLQARLVERDRRRRPQRRAGDRPAHPRHAFRRPGLRRPEAVHSRGVVERGAVVHLTTQYLYDEPDLAVSAVSGALSQSGRPFTHGFEFYLGAGDALLRVREPGGRALATRSR